MENQLNNQIRNKEDLLREQIKNTYLEKFKSFVDSPDFQGVNPSKIVEMDVFKNKFLNFVDTLEIEALSIFKDFDFNKQVSFVKFLYIRAPQYDSKIFTAVDIHKFEIFHENRGYGHPDLLERERLNPIKTKEEESLGCFIEQIEPQARQAVLSLTRKGYKTIQSGILDIYNWSNIFDFDYPLYKDFDKKIINDTDKDFVDKYGVHVKLLQINDRGTCRVEILPLDNQNLISIVDWKTILNDFASKMPDINKG